VNTSDFAKLPEFYPMFSILGNCSPKGLTVFRKAIK